MRKIRSDRRVNSQIIHEYGLLHANWMRTVAHYLRMNIRANRVRAARLLEFEVLCVSSAGTRKSLGFNCDSGGMALARLLLTQLFLSN
jgi:hypothetical protein